MSHAQGVFVPVVGPSGAGKDSIMSHARERLGDTPSVHFVRRVVTRPCDPNSEAHDTLDEAGFIAAERAGVFALSWRSHGLCYGIPRYVEDRLAGGQTVVANLSRASVAESVARFGRVMPVMITVAPEILAERLAARGRESREEIAARLARAVPETDLGAPVHEIANNGRLEDACEAFVTFLKSVR
ncbi:phosphonate metabolism protein/1,5-bisphosphokinase (PRPP-forming) PhnN [Aliihoeflea sp. PC F10.4]